MAKIVSIDWVPRYRDAGYSELIESLAPQGLEHSEFLSALNGAGGLPEMNLPMLVEYMASVKQAGDLKNIEVIGRNLPAPDVKSRPPAPTGLGQDGTAIWFDKPNEGVFTIALYVNGRFVTTVRRNLAVNRSFPKSGVAPGDIVQICLVKNRVPGWWARIEVE